jgi:hypothetical protein
MSPVAQIAGITVAFGIQEKGESAARDGVRFAPDLENTGFACDPLGLIVGEDGARDPQSITGILRRYLQTYSNVV